MPTRFNRILIPVFIALLLSLGRQGETTGQAPANSIYLPIVSYNLTGWIGPSGGSSIAIAVDPTNPSIAYAGTIGSGIFKTIDGGNSWGSINNGITNLQIYSLAVDPKNHLTIYAGTYHSQVFKSTNGGNSWSWSGTGMQAEAIVYSLAVDPVNPANVYASTRGVSNNNNPPWNGVLYKSTDAGQSWGAVLTNVGGAKLMDWAYSVTVNPKNPQQIFAAFHETGPYRSNNAGANWSSIAVGVSDLSGRSIIISPSDPSRLYYGVWHTDGVYRTSNGGDLWNPANQGAKGADVYSLAVHPSDPDTVYLASYSFGILRTDDAGGGWIPSGLQADHCFSIVVNPQRPFTLYTGTTGDGLYRSTDGGYSWQHSDLGIYNAMVSAVVQSPSSPYSLFASVYGGGVFRSINHGQTWDEINQGLSDKYVHGIVLDPANPSILYAFTESGGLFQNNLSSGNGWVKVGQGLPLTDTYQPAYSPDDPLAPLDSQESFANPVKSVLLSPQINKPILTMVYSPSNPSIAYLGTFGGGAYRSTNGGLSWIGAELGGQSVRSLAVDLVDPNLVYAATNIAGNLYYSTNGGTVWNPVSFSPTIYSLTASPKVSGVVYVGTSNGIYRFKDGTFTSLGLSDQSVTSIGVNSGTIYAGTGTGAYYSIDVGVTWNPVDDRLNEQTVLSINFDTNISNVIYFSTKAHGILLVTTR